jgi:glucose-1-phosphate thymidylyltransferase
MRSIVLAGGYAKRLWPLTLDKPKPLLPLGNKCILDFIISKLMEVDNLEEIIISTNKKFEDHFINWLNERNYKKISIISEPSTREEEKLGPISAIWEIVKNKPGDYIIIAGDNIFSVSLKEMVDFYKKVKSPIVALFEMDNIELVKQYACVAIEKDSSIIDFEEKPKVPKTCLVATCIYILPWSSLSKIEYYLKTGNPPDPIGKFIEWLSKNEKIYGFKFKGYWYDIGSYESYMKAKEFFNKLLF